MSPMQGIALGGAVVLILVVALVRAVAPVALMAAAAPFWSVGNFFTASAALPESAASLKAEVERLKKENEALTNEHHALAASLGENAESAAGVSAGVLARPPLSPYDVVIVGKGSADGVYAGMRVIAHGVPAGVIESTSVSTARVVLYSASGQATEGWIGEERVPVTLHGQGAGAFSADVPREAAIAEGDTVYLPGPGALPMGTVAKIESNASSPRATVRIRPRANPFTMTVVSIIAAPSP